MSLAKINNNNFSIKGKIVCKYFILGKCIKGKNCPYLHMSKIECPNYHIGYCKDGPLCQFSHIKKDKYSEDELNEEEMEEDEKENEIKEKGNEIINDDETSSTPLAEDFINDSENENRNIKNNNSINSTDLIKENNNNNLKKEINNNKNKNEKMNYPEIPISYLEYYYNKPISMIFSELENQNLPEVIALQKKYALSDSDSNIQISEPIIKKENLNSNTLNLNFNNFNMNFDLNNNIQSFPMQNEIYSNFNFNPNFNPNYNFIPNKHLINKDQIEYIINKDKKIYYYLIKIKNNKEIKKSYDSNIINLPEKLYNKYKYVDLFANELTIIIIIYNYEYDEFAGFAKLQYPLLDNFSENESENNQNLYQIEWLWKNKMSYSEVSHLMNRADHDHFLNESKNGCPIDKDLGNYICRLMIKRLSREEVIELMNEKQIFENQIQFNRFNQYFHNLKRYKYDYEYDDYRYDDYYNDYDDYYYSDDYDDYNENSFNNKNNYNNYNRTLSKQENREKPKYYRNINEYEYNEEYYLNKRKRYNITKKYDERNENKYENKYETSYNKRYKKRNQSRSRSRSMSRSYYYSENSTKRHKRRKEFEKYSNYKHRKNKEKYKKIHSQVIRESSIDNK